MTDPRIDKLVKKECDGHDYPNPEDYGNGTVAHCGKCRLQATKSTDKEGDIWVYSYPEKYTKLELQPKRIYDR